MTPFSPTEHGRLMNTSSVIPFQSSGTVQNCQHGSVVPHHCLGELGDRDSDGPVREALEADDLVGGADHLFVDEMPVLGIRFRVFAGVRCDVLQQSPCDVDAAPDGNARVAVFADDVSVDALRSDPESLSEQVSDARRAEHRSGRDDAVLGESAQFPGDPGHYVARVADDDEDAVRTVLGEVRDDAFEDVDVLLDEFPSRLPLLLPGPGGDDANL